MLLDSCLICSTYTKWTAYKLLNLKKYYQIWPILHMSLYLKASGGTRPQAPTGAALDPARDTTQGDPDPWRT